MNYCYHCHRLPWPPPSPFPLGVTINLPPSCLLLKDSQTPPLASPVLLKAKNKSTRSQGRMELRTASHCLTRTLALRVPRIPWREPSFQRRTSFSYKYSMAFFLTFKTPHHQKSAHGREKVLDPWDRVFIRAIPSHQRSFWRICLRCASPLFNQTSVLFSKSFGSHAVIKYKEHDFINRPLTLS